MIEIALIEPGSPDIAICARWRVAEFASVIGASFEDEQRTLTAFVAEPARQVALIAHRDGIPAGTCLLVPSEIDPMHALTPWLAGLYVTPEHRCEGVGEALVRAIEAQARARGHQRLYLYTDTAVAYYQRLGWRTVDRVAWMGCDTTLMVCQLHEAARPV